MSTGEPLRVSAVPRLEWPIAGAFLPLWYGYLSFAWWRFAMADLAGVPDARSIPVSPGVAAGLTVAGRFTGFLVEAAAYRLVWTALGRRLPFWRFFSVVASASAADLVAGALADLSVRRSELGPWLAPLAGLDLVGSAVFHGHAAARAAFGAFGLLTAVRVAVTGVAQRQALSVGLSQALGLTAGLWLMSRLAVYCAVDLMKGMSPLPGS